MTASGVQVRPTTPQNWDDVTRLFDARGGPHYCWCSPYRFANAHAMDAAQKKQAIRGRVAEQVPVGVLAYVAGVPVGWCSIAPRETYVKLARSRTMPHASEQPTWTVLCFFVARPHRRRGIAAALLRGAVAYARANGAKEIEGYPYDTAGITATHRGHSSLFAAAGFHREGTRWSLAVRRRAGTKRGGWKPAAV